MELHSAALLSSEPDHGPGSSFSAGLLGRSITGRSMPPNFGGGEREFTTMHASRACRAGRRLRPRSATSIPHIAFLRSESRVSAGLVVIHWVDGRSDQVPVH